MKNVLLDTHVLVWLLLGKDKIGPKAQKMISNALEFDNLYVSAISFWEVAMLVDRGRLQLSQSVGSWRKEILSFGFKELPLCGDLAILTVSLSNLHSDPADRMIVATAKHKDLTLLTCDSKILEWDGDVKIVDAGK